MENVTLRSDAQPVISVILITYNHERYIEQAIQSVLMQSTHFSIEILIGDDASTDGTSEIVRKYAHQYPDLVIAEIRETNLGASKNAYFLLQRAKGKYLASLEGDDYWTDPYKLQRQVEFLESHPEFIGTTHKIKCVDQFGVPISRVPDWMWQKERFTLQDYRGIYLPGQASSLVRRNIFQNPEHDYSILIRADSMVSDRTAALIFLLQGDFYCLPDEMGAYRYVTEEDGNNLTSRLFRRGAGILKDYYLTCELERYAQQEFDKALSFSKLKTELYAKALYWAILEKSDESKKTAKLIRQDRSVGWRGPVYFVLNCLRIFVRRKKRTRRREK